MPSMEGEEDCYLKDISLAQEVPLEAHHKQKESALIFSTGQNSALVYPNRKNDILLCKIVQ